MTPRFVFHPAAVAELREARDWYEQQRPGLGAELGTVIEAVIDRIRLQPALYPEVLPGVRRAVLARFPYAPVYRERADAIEIVAVFHHRRDPRVWQRRAAVYRTLQLPGASRIRWCARHQVSRKPPSRA